MNGLTALETARRVEPDRILLDLMLPGLDGIDLFNKTTLRRQVFETKGMPTFLVRVKLENQERKSRMICFSNLVRFI